MNFEISKHNFWLGNKENIFRSSIVKVCDDQVLNCTLDSSNKIINTDNEKINEEIKLLNNNDSLIINGFKLNACHLIIIKSVENNKISFIHLTPNILEKNPNIYNQILQKYSNEEVNIIIIGNFKSIIFKNEINKLNIKISSLRIVLYQNIYKTESMFVNIVSINLDNFMNCDKIISDNINEPKSIYIYYVPEDDNIIIYADMFTTTNSQSIHIASNVFSGCSLPLLFQKICLYKNKTDFRYKNNYEFNTYFNLLINKVNPEKIMISYKYKEAPVKEENNFIWYKMYLSTYNEFDYFSLNEYGDEFNEEIKLNKLKNLEDVLNSN